MDKPVGRQGGGGGYQKFPAVPGRWGGCPIAHPWVNFFLKEPGWVSSVLKKCSYDKRVPTAPSQNLTVINGVRGIEKSPGNWSIKMHLVFFLLGESNTVDESQPFQIRRFFNGKKKTVQKKYPRRSRGFFFLRADS